jgi:hypothetical protein
MANFFPLVKLCVDLGQKKKKEWIGPNFGRFFFSQTRLVTLLVATTETGVGCCSNSEL